MSALAEVVTSASATVYVELIVYRVLKCVPCQDDDKCQNELNKTLVEDIEVSEEDFIEDIISSRELLHFACINQMD